VTSKDRAALRRKLKANVVKDGNGCWLWTAGLKPKGYAQVRWRGSICLGHRLAYEAFVAEVDEGMVVHHTCSVRRCINPKHLQAVSHHENLAEMMGRQSYLKRIAELEEILAACSCGAGGSSSTIRV